MTLSIDRIQRAREAGYDDDKIVESIERRDPAFGDRIKKAREAGYNSQAIMQSIEKRLSTSREFPDNSDQVQKFQSQQTQSDMAAEPEGFQVSSSGGTSTQSLTPEQKDLGAHGQSTPASLLASQVDPSYSFVSPETDKAFDQAIIHGRGKDHYKELIKPEEVTKEQLKKMSVADRLAYSEDLNRYRQYQTAKGTGKGIISGLTLGLSEKIPALQPREDEHGVLFGEFLGSVLPIEGIAKIVGYPLLKLAGKSAVYKNGLEAFSRMAGLDSLFQIVGHEPVTKAGIMAVTGAAYQGSKEAIQTGELPSAEELTKYAAEWAAFDAVLQSFGLAGRFAKLAKESGGNTANKINEVISKVNLKENNPEILKRNVEKGINDVFGDLGKGLTDNLYKDVFEGIQQGKTSLTNGRDEFMEAAKANYDTGLIKSEDDLRKFREAWDKKFTEKVKNEAITEAPKKEAESSEIAESENVKENKVETQLKSTDEKKPSEGVIEPQKKKIEKSEESVAESKTSDITPATQGSVEKNIQSLERQIVKAEKKGDTLKIQKLQKNLSLQKKKLKNKEPAVPIIETTGKSAHEQIDVPKTFSERFIDGVNTTVDAIKNPGRSLSNTGRAINENLFNFLAPIERLERNIPVQDQVTSRIKLAQSSTSTVNAVIENGIFADVGNRLQSGGLKEAYGDYTWTRLTRKMKKPQDYSIQELDEYRTSKQSLKRQLEGKKTGIDTKQARKDVHRLAPKYQKIDKDIREYNKAVTSTFGKDLLGKDLIEMWNNDYHSSMYRLMDSGEGSMLAAGSLEPKQGFFKFKGSQRKILPTSESDVYNTAMLIQNSKKNDAVLQYKRNVEKGLLPGKIVKAEVPKMPKSVAEQLEIPKDLNQVGESLYGQTRAEAFTPSKNRIRGWENGKAFEIEVPAEVVEVFKGMQPMSQHLISKALTSVNRVFSKGLTLSPKKFFSIWARDALSSIILSKSGVTPIDTAKATADILGNSQLYKQFKFDGGDLYATRLASRIDRAKKVEELVTPGKSGPIVPLEKLYEYFKKYENKLGDISLAVPFAEYKAGIAKYGDTAEGRILAMMDAKRVTYDPTRKGKSILVREVAPFINFWNVTLQDLSMVASNLKRPEVWAKGLALITMPTLALKMWNEGNPDYDDLNALDKAAFWHLYFGKHHVRVPAPWLLGTVFKTIPEALFDTAKGRGGEGSKALYHNAVDQISGNFNPLIQTSIELMTGVSPASPLGAFLGVESKSPDVIPRRLQNLPKELQYTSSTSQLSRNFAPLIGVSPVIMDRVLNNLGATLSRDALALVDEIAYQTGLAEDKRPEKQYTNYLLLGNFVSSSPVSRTKYAQEFYDKLEQMRVGKAGEKHGVPPEGIKKLEKAGLTQYNTRINKKFTEYREVQESNINSQVKKKSLDKIQDEINAMYKEAVLKTQT